MDVNNLHVLIGASTWLATSLSALMPDAADQGRLPPIPADRMTDAQKKASAEFEALRKQPVFGPFAALLRSPELMLRASDLGDYLRFRNTLPRALSEFAILLMARRWSQEYEWYVHAPDALAAGLSAEIIQAVAEGCRPERMTEDETLVYDFCAELGEQKSVTDGTYARTVARFGEQGMMDLVGVNGYYSLISMVLSVARTPLPPGHALALPPLRK